MKALYLDCFSGISGDMFLGAMIDAGCITREKLSDSLAALGVEGMEITAARVARSGITGTKVDVIAPDKVEERHFSDILGIIENSGLSPDIKKRSRAIFRRLAEAESKVHGVGIEDVHFHEVGAVDTIADVVGAAICLKESGIETVISSPVNVGSGTVRTAHGILPVPAPATLEILKGAPIYSSGTGMELVTPTGAAILMEICKDFGPMPGIKIESAGYGAGSRELDMPNMLRAIVGESFEIKQKSFLGRAERHGHH